MLICETSPNGAGVFFLCGRCTLLNLGWLEADQENGDLAKWEADLPAASRLFEAEPTREVGVRSRSPFDLRSVSLE